MLEARKRWVRTDPRVAVPNPVLIGRLTQGMSIATVQEPKIDAGGLETLRSDVADRGRLRSSEEEVRVVHKRLLAGDRVVVPRNVGPFGLSESDKRPVDEARASKHCVLDIT